MNENACLFACDCVSTSGFDSVSAKLDTVCKYVAVTVTAEDVLTLVLPEVSSTSPLYR